MENSLFETNACGECVVLHFPDVDALEPTVPGTPAEEIIDRERVHAKELAEREAVIREELEAAREEAVTAAQREAEVRFRDALETERSALAVACASFAKERSKYFAAIEAEVVKLALAVAARVLQREAHMDPMLLMGAVRVALSKISDPEGVVLSVGPEQADVWRRAMRAHGVTVEADARFLQGEVQLRASAGVVELGVAAQLQEIERGFFDLLEKRPA